MSKPITSFDEIKGHRNVVKFIQNSLKKNIIQDVVLFYGPSGLGKTSMAKLTAVDLVANGDENLKKRLVKEIIIENKSNEFIKVIGMTDVAEKEDEIEKVRSELSLGFSTNGIKALIIDEVQGMSKKAQDGLLTALESLTKGVYIFMCTNDKSKLQDALYSRCRAKFQLHNLNRMEIAQLIESQIEYKHLRFTMNKQAVITLIGYYSNFQARDVVNLLDNFEDGSVIDSDTLSVFVNDNVVSILLQLVNYLYGSMTLGLEFVSTLEIDDVFQNAMIEILKVTMGGESKLLTREDESKLISIITGKDKNVLLHFVVEILSYNRLTSKQVAAAFINNNASLRKLPEYTDKSLIQGTDNVTMEFMRDNRMGAPQIPDFAETAIRSESLIDILAKAESINGGSK